MTCRDSWTHITTQRKLPSRLLEVTGSLDSLKLRVMDTRSLPVETEYMTLSHCVGEVDFLDF
jgi:hypothetical protein